jgi:hypothetical protein
MVNTVFILGAGSNQTISNYEGLSPPLSNNFLEIAIQSEPYRSRIEAGDRTDLHILFDYIKIKYDKTIDQLRNDSFNLEEFVTDLEKKYY